MQILQLYATALAIAVVGLVISMLTTVLTKPSRLAPELDQDTTEEQLKWAWWVKVRTDQPNCTYYFGPFASKKSAEASQSGYVEDLEREGACGITIQTKWYKPKELTIYEDKLAEAGGY